MARTDQGVIHSTMSASASLLNPIPRGIYVNAGGTATMEDAAGTSIVYTLTAGTILPFRPHKVTALGGGCVLIRWD